MSKRHSDALSIQGGACNPTAIAHSIIRACNEIIGEDGGTDAIRQDPAIRLMVHQLSFLTNIAEIDRNPSCSYRELIQQCQEQCLSVQELAESRGIKSYDIALPQDWVNLMQKAGFDPRGKVVWSYDNDTTFGRPAALTQESARQMKKLDQIIDT